MPDEESETYRARRALVDPRTMSTPAAPGGDAPTSPQDGETAPAVASDGNPDDPASRTPVAPAASRTSAALPASRTPAAPDEDAPKPLYRDEVGDLAEGPGSPVRPSGSSAPAAPTPSGPSGTSPTGTSKPGEAPTPEDPSEVTTVFRPLRFTQRRTPPRDEEETTVLPRTVGGRRGARSEDPEDLDDEPRAPLHRRAQLILLVAAVAAVVVVGIAVIYAVAGVGAQPGTAPSPSASASVLPTPVPSSGSGAVLTEASLLGADDARQVDSKRTWTVASTQTGQTTDAPAPACLGPQPADGQPTPTLLLNRLLSGDGTNPPGILHQASAYASPEEAVQAYAVVTKELGTCASAGAYLVSGQVVSGLGDQSVAVVAAVSDGSSTQAHTIVVSRTGTVLDLVDATQPTTALPVAGVTKAMAAVVSLQCQAAGGQCADQVQVKAGPPPLGGDEPGFLATGDLPPAGKTPTPWVGTPVELPQESFLGSQCETVNWATTPAEQRTSRTYLLQDTAGTFGLNEVILTLKDDATATKLVEKISSDLQSCAKRKLTATVSKPARVSGTGAMDAKISGYTAVVAQKSTAGTQKYRVGIVATGSKVVYTFLNPTAGFDLSDAQWNTVAVRAGERATQVN